MDIRQCNANDLMWLLDLTQQFNDKLFDVPLNRDKSFDYLAAMIEHGVCYRGNHGAIVGMVAPDPFRDWNVLVEIGWFTDTPGEGLALLDTFIEHGRQVGVDEVRMTTLERNKSVAKLLQRKGFVPIETSHRLLL